MDNVQVSIHGTRLTGLPPVEVKQNTLVFDVTGAWAEFQRLVVRAERDQMSKDIECCLKIPFA